MKTNLYILFLPDVVVCCYILYNMILDGEEFEIETLMAQLDLDNFVNYVHQAYWGHIKRNIEEPTNDNDIEANFYQVLSFWE